MARYTGYTSADNRIVRIHHDDTHEFIDALATELDVPYQHVFTAYLDAVASGELFGTCDFTLYVVDAVITRISE